MMPGGCQKGFGGKLYAARAVNMNLCQIGAAPVTPVVLTICELSALPTQTPVTMSGVYPTVQLSV